jgi:excisionase family DNA binding protein
VLSPPYQDHEPPPRAFLDVAEAAEQLGVDKSTLYRRLRQDRFPGVRLGGRYLVPAAVIAALVAEAMTTGRCIDIEEWVARWRDERQDAAVGPARPSCPFAPPEACRECLA